MPLYRFVGSNGYVTFLYSDGRLCDSDLKECHYAKTGISIFNTDLNPSRGGAISYQILAGKAVVSWEAVPYYPATARCVCVCLLCACDDHNFHSRREN